MNLRDRLPERLVTERLVLRALGRDDLDDLVQHANNPKVVEHTASLPFPYERQHGLGFIDKLAHRPDQRHFAIADRHDGRLMGVIGFRFDDHKPAELGYWLGEAFWGQGYVSEAVQVLLAAAADCGIMPVRARVLLANPASARVLEKAGFTVVERGQSVGERHGGKPLLTLEWRR